MLLLLLQAGLVQKSFFVRRGWGGSIVSLGVFRVGTYSRVGAYLTFWAFEAGTYLRLALIRRSAMNRISRVIKKGTKYVSETTEEKVYPQHYRAHVS